MHATTCSSLFAAAALVALAALALLPGAGAAQPARAFRAGAATSNITPKLGTSINGNMTDARAAHVHDELHARCLVLNDGTTKIAFAVCDACMVPQSVTEAVRKLVQEETGIPADHVLISATHAHSCGTLTAVFQSDPDADYPAFVVRRIADGIRRADHNLAPARVGWGAGQVADQLFNRRWRMKPGTPLPNPFGGTDQVKMNPGVGNPNLLEPAGPVDPEVSVLSVVTPEGRPIALLANYSLHYVGGTGPATLSADYYGAFADRVAQLLGAEHQDPPFVALMSNGTSGDVNNINVRGSTEKLPSYVKIRQVADEVAAEVARVQKGIRHRDFAALTAAAAQLTLGVRRPSAAEVARAKEILAAAKPGEPLAGLDAIYAHETMQMAGYPAEVPVMLQAFRIGDLAIAAAPCEIFAEIGLELKRRSPIRPLFAISLANGYNGYLPTPEQHALGGYETWRAKSSYLEVEASRKITARLLALLEQLAKPASG